ncbi:hypothetical protein PN465_04820 [Nodularia spumigena CS-584]|uniref:hypothetical protein n=1 Tax=Nodularia spumigena TaxID=70799 RepID=UPI0002D91681|nr:hypothetical protein [Nodularia spumigena]MDB9322660.1 hypothetical protein [Nodularia spumigena CS-591/07A]MDB9331840.1 hypothetical protein [Nodularia spumigena CS-591/04]MDB9361486.1 hypothetical protein [Nodularia spumigena CS-588/02]MDB9366587.1 hypothetical protein [Nodularia spumigena CS-588/02A10]MDB9371501.1 hypothetical protein [Nodularia spumigena CS-586/05]MDB9399890.1 hypothetical protein [Microcystis aeruginosa CS-567/02-A1]MDB9533770.1 hypothetical protein [Nodularia spumig
MKVSFFQIATVRAFLGDERAKEQIKNEIKQRSLAYCVTKNTIKQIQRRSHLN